MLDTVKLASPPLGDREAERIERACVLRSAVEIATGEVQYSLTTGSLEGSYDDRVSVRVEREEWVTMAPTGRAGAMSRPVTMKQPCAPYLVMEGSIHKALMGHNVYGGPLPPVLSCCWFVDDVAARLGVSLPEADDWTVQRIDWAEAFELPSFEAVQEYISGLNMAQFPRRDVIRFGEESLMSPGRTTAVKVYHKGPEFYAHDRRRLRNYLGDGELCVLQDRAHRILRLETSIKARKLADDFGGKPLVVQVTRDYLERVHDREAGRLLKEAQSEVETVRTHREVSSRLREKYDDRLANTLFGTWMQLAALGEAEVRRHMPRATFFRQRKQIADAGVSWQAADVRIVPRCSSIPSGFSPIRADRHRLTEEAEAVKLRLYTYQRAA